MSRNDDHSHTLIAHWKDLSKHTTTLIAPINSLKHPAHVKPTLVSSGRWWAEASLHAVLHAVLLRDFFQQKKIILHPSLKGIKK